MKRLVPLVAYLAILMIFTSYTVGILSENDGQLNVEDTDYEDSYESNVKVQNASMSILGVLPLILVAIMLIIGFAILKKSARGL